MGFSSSGRRDIGPRTPTLGPILFRLRLDKLASLNFLRKIIGPPGFEFPRESGHSSRRGATFENGRGQVLGGQPGTPIEPPIQRIDSRSVGRSYLPTTPKAVSYGNWGLRGFVGIGWGLVGD